MQTKKLAHISDSRFGNRI